MNFVIWNGKLFVCAFYREESRKKQLQTATNVNFAKIIFSVAEPVYGAF
jgi:hypothetical protein